MYYEIYSNSMTPFKIIALGYSKDPMITQFGPGQRNLYIVHYVISGKGYYNGNPVSAGQGFLIYPHQLEEYHPDENDPWEYFWVISSDAVMQQLFERYNADKNTLIFDYNAVSIVKDVADEIVSRKGERIDSLELFEIYLHILNAHIHNKRAEQRTNAEIYTDFCVNYIKSHLKESITVSRLTELCGVSQPYLYRIFNSKFNISPKQYIVKEKLDEAKRMLIKTDMPIAHIATSVGYSDVLAFSKMFYVHEKIYPGQYRESMQRGD